MTRLRTRPDARTPKPITFPQLCDVAKAILLQEPTIDDSEWKARLKDRLVTLRFADPTGDQMTRALAAVETTLEARTGPRPVPVPPTPETPSAAPLPPTGRTRHPEGWTIIQRLLRDRSTSCAPSSSTPASGPALVLPIAESAVLDEFWSAARVEGQDRLALVRAYAQVAVERPPAWDAAQIRAQAAAAHQRLRFDACFVCGTRERALAWQHVVRLEHGGSNHPRNHIGLCRPCGGEIYPGAPVVPRGDDWSDVRALATRSSTR